MATLTITVSMDKQVCALCGKRGTGYYEGINTPGKYVCHKCILKNIGKRKPNRKK